MAVAIADQNDEKEHDATKDYPGEGPAAFVFLLNLFFLIVQFMMTVAWACAQRFVQAICYRGCVPERFQKVIVGGMLGRASVVAKFVSTRAIAVGAYELS